MSIRWSVGNDSYDFLVFRWRRHTNFNMSAVTHRSRWRELKFHRISAIPGMGHDFEQQPKVWVAFLDFISWQYSSVTSVSVSEFLSGRSWQVLSQSRPVNHKRFLESAEVAIPLESVSAGFSFPGQCPQHQGGTNSWILVTWFSTNYFDSWLHPHIQYRTTLESVYHTGSPSITSGCKATWTLTISFDSNKADNSSKHGIPKILVLGVTKAVDSIPLVDFW